MNPKGLMMATLVLFSASEGTHCTLVVCERMSDCSCTQRILNIPHCLVFSWLLPHETAAVLVQVLCTPYNHAPVYSVTSCKAVVLLHAKLWCTSGSDLVCHSSQWQWEECGQGLLSQATGVETKLHKGFYPNLLFVQMVPIYHCPDKAVVPKLVCIGCWNWGTLWDACCWPFCVARDMASARSLLYTFFCCCSFGVDEVTVARLVLIP